MLKNFKPRIALYSAFIFCFWMGYQLIGYEYTMLLGIAQVVAEIHYSIFIKKT